MLTNVCWLGLDSPNQTEFIYAQIVQDELGYGGSVKRFIPSPMNNLMDFMRGQPEKMFIIIGSAELAMGKFLVFYKFMEAFQVVSKDGLKALLEFEIKAKKPASPPLTGKAAILAVANSVYRERRTSGARPNTPEASDDILEGTCPIVSASVKIESGTPTSSEPPSLK